MARETREVWSQRVQRFKDSGLTAKEFAAEMGLNVHTLTHWKWRLSSKARAAEAHGASDVLGSFVEVTRPALARPTPRVNPKPGLPEAMQPLELVFRNGLLLRIPAQFHEGALRQVLSVMEGL